MEWNNSLLNKKFLSLNITWPDSSCSISVTWTLATETFGNLMANKTFSGKHNLGHKFSIFCFPVPGPVSLNQSMFCRFSPRSYLIDRLRKCTMLTNWKWEAHINLMLARTHNKCWLESGYLTFYMVLIYCGLCLE